MEVYIEIPGPPVPWQRAAPGKHGGAHNPAKSHRYKQHVRACIRSAMMQAGLVREWPTNRQYDVEIWMYFPDLRTRDDDNVEKALKDAGSGALWFDDTWTAFRTITKHMRLDRERPRVEMTVRVVEEPE